MTQPSWDRIEELYHAALARAPGEREAFVASACADAGLRSEVLSLLAHEASAERLLEQPALAAGTEKLSLLTGTRLGPYEVLGLVGAGGMGEVYRARDIRLGREVAIKTLPASLAEDPERLRRFEREARAVASLNHPHVLTIHDVGTQQGVPYVVTELLEGETLREVMKKRSPAPRQVLALLLQAAQGVGAAHRSGIVHRDLKPENLFLTSEGRIKVLDFGLALTARAGAASNTSGHTRPGELLGTVAYMSPEQVRGEAVDPRSDVFSLGVVLHELLSGKHPFRRDTLSATLFAVLQEAPPELGVRGLPPGVGALLARCLDKRREERFASAGELAAELEGVLGGTTAPPLEQVEERTPYPGLGAFTEADASSFFGREEEARALWDRLSRRWLLAVIGPSGAGKTSFVRAGVAAGRPPGWGAIVCTPGTNPVLSLAQGLTRELAGDPEAISDLLHGVTDLAQGGTPERVMQAASRWRRRHDEALLVVDQLEELFTLNGAEAQARFAALLGKLAAEGDVHVLLSLRDDFLVRSQEQAPLREIASELTILLPLAPDALRRALVEPARERGYRFEDDALVEQMVSEVAGERAALPLLAFAVSRLWERRDREKKLLTRGAYQAIGGVAGALAQHAEATLEAIGPERTPLVREVFRNLVTSQGTRAVRERDELLSVFDRSGTSAGSPPAAKPSGWSRAEAEEVVARLVDARLLTAYEVQVREGEPGRARVEIAHESLLDAWPRLERWRAQDADGALLRDQLRQAAQLWHDRARPEELLWTGTAYRDFALWRERYPGGLSAGEEAFAEAATRLAGRRRRRRRMVVATVLAAVAAVAVTTSVLWRRTEAARQEASSEARSRQAAELLALGRVRLDDFPSAALAYAIASLERADNEPARRFAVEALWKGPPALVMPGLAQFATTDWSPDGRWLALGGYAGVLLLDRDSGEHRQILPGGAVAVGFTRDSSRLVTRQSTRTPTGFIHIWSLPEARLLDTWTIPEDPKIDDGEVVVDRRVVRFVVDRRGAGETAYATVRPLDGGPERMLARWRPRGLDNWTIDPSGKWLQFVQGDRVLRLRLEAPREPPRLIGRHPGEKITVASQPQSDQVATGDERGEVRIWDGHSSRLVRMLRSPADARGLRFDPHGRFIATEGSQQPRGPSTFIFDLNASRYAEPLPLLDPELGQMGAAFDPRGQWVASGSLRATVLWNWAGKRSTVLGGQRPTGGTPSAVGGIVGVNVAFTPEGRLVSTWEKGVRVWPLPGTDDDVRDLRLPTTAFPFEYLTVGPQWRFGAVAERVAGRVITFPLDGSPPAVHPLEQAFPRSAMFIASMALDSEGRRAALACLEMWKPGSASLHVLDLASGSDRTLRAEPRNGGECKERVASVGAVEFPVWLPDGRLVSDGYDGLRVWNLADGSSRWLRPCRATVSRYAVVRATPDSRSIVTLHVAASPGDVSDLSVTDLATATTREVTSHGKRVASLALDPSGTTLVTGGADGLVRVGPLLGGEPHLLYGHTGIVMDVAVSPDGRRIASGSNDGSIRLWPMPEGRPLHTFAYEALLAKLRSLTNLRVVVDSASAGGYRVDPGPLPPWKEAPTW